ncbi:catechol 1,2-dioxygenase [Agrobacterium rhizogenes]|uniref:VOC family protein n=1 Tax=Rhizobium rhizogenes TaxID=359 RepID=UPI00157248B7|nr:VOC family protein [Rhizobium rhizogenes]NTH16767.1 catechol 1,2-dioxygenase [Rhizobium rhizogenes]
MLDRIIGSTNDAASRLPEHARMGVVHLRVRDIDVALSVWRDLIGLTLITRSGHTAALGAGSQTLIILEEGARWPAPSQHLGLYHVAIRIPTREDFARAVARIDAAHYRHSPTDHLVTATTYLSDPDGNGIELMFETFDRGHLDVVDGQFRAFTKDGSLHSGREPLDLQTLFSSLDQDSDLTTALPAGTDIGHVHLHVTNLDRTMVFYTDVIGLKPRMKATAFRMFDTALGSNPHAIAFNIWVGPDARLAPADAAGLNHFTVDVRSTEALDQVAFRLRSSGHAVRRDGALLVTEDPSGNCLHLIAGDSHAMVFSI